MGIGRFIWNSVKAVLACIFGALGIMTNVTPQQAQSNLSAWFSNPPAWMLPPHIDAWGEILFFSLATLLLLSIAWPWLYERKEKARARATNDPNQRFRHAEVSKPSEEFLSMKEAAIKVYSIARPLRQFWALIAEDNAKESSFMPIPSREDRILATIANLIAGKIPIYGEAWPSRDRELIENVKQQHGELFDGGNRFQFLLFDKTQYHNVCVKTSDLDSVAEYVKTTMTENSIV